MTTNISTATSDLRAALLQLKPTGPKGFEGLVSVILTTLTGQTFRLASSGRQDGKDGGADHVAFETKLYKGKINKNEVLSKITSIIGSVSPPDLWVLGATIPLDTQLIDLMRAATHRTGVAVEVWDWPAHDSRPPLAVACAAAATEVAQFFTQHLKDKALSSKASAALAAIAASAGFDAAKTTLMAAVTEPSLAGPFTRVANRRWLRAAFQDRHQARAVFGQPLAPAAQGSMATRDRRDLTAALAQAFVSKPQSRLFAVLGGEGVGKSWLFAQTWLGLPHPPLTLLLNATEIAAATGSGSVAEVLLGKLFAQTSTGPQPHLCARWEARFERWRGGPALSVPRFVVCVDGLNQQPDFNWARWLLAAVNEVTILGGALVITARQSFFDGDLRAALAGLVETIAVPSWTLDELREILLEKGLRPDALSQDVCERLCNPRLLAIALELLANGAIRELAELTVERLLFEHIRANARDGVEPEPADQFVHRLAGHAADIIDRAKAETADDRLIFEARFGVPVGHELSAGLLAVMGEHFFRPLPSDKSLYTLTDDGLALALGLAIIKALQKAERNGHSVVDQLDVLLEPIAALDKTTEATFSAILAAMGDSTCSDVIRQALITGFLGLQNIDSTRLPAFCALIREHTHVAAEALATLSLDERFYAHGDWLVQGLRGRRADPASWAIMGRHIDRWLRTYSMAPELGVSTPAHEVDKYAQATEFRRQALSDAWDGLSSAERRCYTDQMARDDGVNPGVLHELAFWLLAGMPLAEFAQALVVSALSEAFNCALVSPYDDFVALIGFNARDWARTRSELLAAADFLKRPGVSTTGGWARVAILRGLATSEDAAEEAVLVETLTVGRERMKGWRRIDDYCATDPCDPDALEPDNVAATADRYAALDIDALANGPWMGANDHFMRDALPGVARFRPQSALTLHRRYAVAVANRDGKGLFAAMSGVAQNSAALDRLAIDALLAAGRRLSTPRLGTPESSDAWAASQYAIFAAFPHQTGDEQLAYLMDLPTPGPLLLKTTGVLRPSDPARLEAAFEAARQSGDDNRKLAALAFARHSGTVLTANVRTMVGELSEDASSFVRAEAFGVIDGIDDAVLLRAFAGRDWRASGLDQRSEVFEIDRGSSLLIKAIAAGLLDLEAGLYRVAPSQFGRATRVLGARATAIIAARLRQDLMSAIDFDPLTKPPYVERQPAEDDAPYPSLLALSDRQANPKHVLERASETHEDFMRRQEEGWAAFDQFEASAVRAGARLIIADVGMSSVSACVALSPAWGRELASLLCHLPEARLNLVRNFGLILATALPAEDAALGKALYDRLEHGSSVVRVTFGEVKVPLEAVVLWRACADDVWDRARIARLDAAANDAELAQEVLAALLAGKPDILRTYVAARLTRSEPVVIARALAVLGFGEPSEFADATLAAYRSEPGLLGRAVTAAYGAYARNRWAKHWFTQMRSAVDPAEFWRYSALFLRIVDGRFGVWEADVPRANAAMRAFEPALQHGIEQRAGSWHSKRQQILFGHKVRAMIAEWSRPNFDA